MVTLLMLELQDSKSHNHYRQSNTATHSPCLEYLLSESLLVRLYEWSVHTGRYISYLHFYNETFNCILSMSRYGYNSVNLIYTFFSIIILHN